MAICQSFPRYVSSLSEYSRLLAQKNALLRGGTANDELLGVYNERMAACGAVITVNRRKYLRRLEEQASPFHGEMSAQRETLSLSYSTQPRGRRSRSCARATKGCLRAVKRPRRRAGWRSQARIRMISACR